MSKLTSRPKYLPYKKPKTKLKTKHSAIRRLFPQNNSDRWSYVEPIPESRTKVNGTIVRNTERRYVVILILASERKPTVNSFFVENRPRTVLKFGHEFDMRTAKRVVWAMSAILHDYDKISTALSGSTEEAEKQ